MEDKQLKIIFQDAQNGKKDSIEMILKLFEPLMYRNSFIDGEFNEDCFQELRIKLINCIKSFDFLMTENIQQSFENTII